MIEQILGARRVERLNVIKADLEARYGVSVIALELDVTDSASADAFLASLPENVRDNVDVLVNNAGGGIPPRPIHDSDLDDLTNLFEANIKGVVKMVKLFVPGMLKRDSGHIINVSSVLGKATLPNMGLYAGSKHMLESINTALRSELVATSIRVSLISPGLTSTEFNTVMFKGDVEKATNRTAGVKILESADIADSIVYIASRPEHVQIQDIIAASTSQASAYVIHRAPPKTA